jgi:hypothetical protein
MYTYLELIKKNYVIGYQRMKDRLSRNMNHQLMGAIAMIVLVVDQIHINIKLVVKMLWNLGLMNMLHRELQLQLAI